MRALLGPKWLRIAIDVAAVAAVAVRVVFVLYVRLFLFCFEDKLGHGV